MQFYYVLHQWPQCDGTKSVLILLHVVLQSGGRSHVTSTSVYEAASLWLESTGTDGRTEGWTDGRMDGWTDSRVAARFCFCSPHPSLVQLGSSVYLQCAVSPCSTFTPQSTAFICVGRETLLSGEQRNAGRNDGYYAWGRGGARGGGARGWGRFPFSRFYPPGRFFSSLQAKCQKVSFKRTKCRNEVGQ